MDGVSDHKTIQRDPAFFDYVVKLGIVQLLDVGILEVVQEVPENNNGDNNYYPKKDVLSCCIQNRTLAS